MSRALAAFALLTFAAFLVRLFPADAVARHALTRTLPPGGPTVVFSRATLQPDGIRLDEVAVQTPGGGVLARAAHVRFRPSLIGLVRDGRGLPWHVDADACGGRLDATVSAEEAATGVAVTWDDADVAACPLPPLAAGALAGRARGVARLHLPFVGAPAGDGRVELEGGQWIGSGPLRALGALHAESASVRWTLHDGRLTFAALDLRGPELTATGSGAVDLVDPLAASAVQLTLALATAPAAPAPLRLLLGPPGTDRRLAVGGTLERPSVLVQ